MGSGGYADVVVSGLEKTDPQFDVVHLDDIVTKTATHPFFCVIAPSTNEKAPTVFLSAGVHGDEPAGVYALMQFLKSHIKNYLPYFKIAVIPCVNPYGFDTGVRENADGANLNRFFLSKNPPREVAIVKDVLTQQGTNYLFALDLHEDHTDAPDISRSSQKKIPRGFYLYENCPWKKELVGHRVTRDLRRRRIRVTRMPDVYNEPCDDGVVRTGGLLDPKYSDRETLEGHALNYTPHAFTAETPTYWSLDERVETHLAVLSKMLNEFRDRTIPPQERRIIIT
jgi:protein MpaA